MTEGRETFRYQFKVGNRVLEEWCGPPITTATRRTAAEFHRAEREQERECRRPYGKAARWRLVALVAACAVAVLIEWMA